MRFYTKVLKDANIHGTDEWRKLYDERCKIMSGGMTPAPDSVKEQLVAVLEDHIFVGYGSDNDEDYPHAEYPFNFQVTDKVGILEMYFHHGNWAFRDGVIYKDLAFVQQVNGGDEWLTLKRDGNKWICFESCSMAAMIRNGSFYKTIRGMCRATVEQCKKLKYMEREDDYE